MRMNRLIASVAFATALMAGAAIPLGHAQASPVLVNGSFESGTAPDPSIGFTTLYSGDSVSITGWTVGSGDLGSIDYIGSYWQASAGNRSLDLNGYTAGSISQTITNLINGQKYEVTFDLAGNPDSGPQNKTLSVTAIIGANTYSFDVTGKTRSAMGWVTESFFFTANGPSSLLTFTSTVIAGGGNGYPAAFGPALDNVAVFAFNNELSQTPLPAALPLFASGLGAMGLFGWRRKRKSAAAVAAA